MTEHADQVLTELLVLRAQGGHTDAVELLVQVWQDRLLRHAQRMTGREDAGKDVMQEAWLSVVRGLSKLDDPSRFGAWAYQIVTRQSAHWIRQQQQQRRAEGKVGLVHEPTNETGQKEDDADEVRVTLQQLPSDQRAILELRYVEGFSIEQIAEALDIVAGTAKSRLFHAREQLRQILERTRK